MVQHEQRSNTRPLHSVILPNYNYASSLGFAVESALAQTESNSEILIVDDGSTDHSLAIAAQLAKQDPRIQVVTHPGHKNKGLLESLRLGIQLTRATDTISILETDDTWNSAQTLENRVLALEENPTISLAFNRCEFTGEAKAIRQRRIHFNATLQPHPLPFPQGVIDHPLLYLVDHNFLLSFSCVTFRASVLRSIHLEPNFSPWLDWWFFSQAAAKGPFYYLPEPLTHWKCHSQSYLMRAHQDMNLRRLRHRLRIEQYRLAQKHALPAKVAQNCISKMSKLIPITVGEQIQLATESLAHQFLPYGSIRREYYNIALILKRAFCMRTLKRTTLFP